jgi:pyruvate ferredoxin oxidoreductase gamma subunit
MFRIRFHGRGGQGMKTASRIVGTAAFRQGYYAQDSPVYGAERRGAPMIAFTRFDSRPVFERGMVASPDLVVIADLSLLNDPLVRPLQGHSPSGSVLLNSIHAPDRLNFITLDFTGLALAHTGSISALGVALGAAAAKVAGLELRFLEIATREELLQLKLDSLRLEKNLDLARKCFADVSAYAVPPQPGPAQAIPEVGIVTPAYDGAWAGTASVATVPNTTLRKTGDWRVLRPIIDIDQCTHCWICFVNCPDGAITLGTADVPQIDYGVCKGCLICAELCPIGAIQAVRESEAAARKLR